MFEFKSGKFKVSGFSTPGVHPRDFLSGLRLNFMTNFIGYGLRYYLRHI